MAVRALAVWKAQPQTSAAEQRRQFCTQRGDSGCCERFGRAAGSRAQPGSNRVRTTPTNTHTHTQETLERAATRHSLVAPREPFFAAQLCQVAMRAISTVCRNITCIEMQRNKRNSENDKQLRLQEQLPHGQGTNNNTEHCQQREPATTHKDGPEQQQR